MFSLYLVIIVRHHCYNFFGDLPTVPECLCKYLISRQGQQTTKSQENKAAKNAEIFFWFALDFGWD